MRSGVYFMESFIFRLLVFLSFVWNLFGEVWGFLVRFLEYIFGSFMLEILGKVRFL